MRSRIYWLLRDLYLVLTSFGIDPLRMINAVRGIPAYSRNLFVFLIRQRRSEDGFSINKLIPCLSDRFDESGAATGHYFHQDLHVARLIFKKKPRRHVDVGSRVGGFVAHVASFRPIEVIDVRPLTMSVPNMKFLQLDITDPLPASLTGYCDSLSCLHALEHFGLGRYGDRVDPYAYIRGFENLAAMLFPRGTFYFSVPMGPQRIEFDSLRVFSLSSLVSLVKTRFSIRSFAYVTDRGDLVRDVRITKELMRTNCGCYYGCAIFELIKRGD